jgi:hypothetical protein
MVQGSKVQGFRVDDKSDPEPLNPCMKLHGELVLMNSEEPNS